MARVASGGRILGVVRKFIPQALGNAVADEANRVVVWLKSPDLFERTEHYRGLQAGANAVAAALERFVDRVEGYDYNSELGQKPIGDGATLARFGDDEIVGEVYQEIMGSLSLGERSEKNSDGSSASLPPVTTASAGTAGNADGRASVESEIAKSRAKIRSSSMSLKSSA